MRRTRAAALAGLGSLVLLLTGETAAEPLDLDAFEIVDLTHAYDADTLYWPTAPSRFELDRIAFGPTPGGWFYAANTFRTPEHGGTHIDAPIHFAAGRRALHEIPLRQLLGPAVVIDLRKRAAAEPDAVLRVADLRAFEAAHGRIARGSLVLLWTGWSRHWPDAKAYLGDDTPGDASALHFPSFGPDAVRMLVAERGIAALGVDTASIDPGSSTDFPVHRIAAEAEVPGFENLTALEKLPPVGATVIALPMKIRGGTGGPLRAVALVPR